MSYHAPNTPNPSSSTQIGYSMTLSATTVTTTSANLKATSTTTNHNIPIGEWIIVGSCLVAGPTNIAIGILYDNVAIGGDCTIRVSGGGSLIAVSGFSSPSQTFSYMPLTPSGCFYSNGTLGIDVILSATSNSSTSDVKNTASLKIIKIA